MLLSLTSRTRYLYSDESNGLPSSYHWKQVCTKMRGWKTSPEKRGARTIDHEEESFQFGLFLDAQAKKKSSCGRWFEGLRRSIDRWLLTNHQRLSRSLVRAEDNRNLIEIHSSRFEVMPQWSLRLQVYQMLVFNWPKFAQRLELPIILLNSRQCYSFIGFQKNSALKWNLHLTKISSFKVIQKDLP